VFTMAFVGFVDVRFTMVRAYTSQRSPERCLRGILLEDGLDVAGGHFGPAAHTVHAVLL